LYIKASRASRFKTAGVTPPPGPLQGAFIVVQMDNWHRAAIIGFADAKCGWLTTGEHV
jgi:hypothetical protein